jgi:hypothetical protein
MMHHADQECINNSNEQEDEKKDGNKSWITMATIITFACRVHSVHERDVCVYTRVAKIIHKRRRYTM